MDERLTTALISSATPNLEENSLRESSLLMGEMYIRLMMARMPK